MGGGGCRNDSRQRYCLHGAEVLLKYATNVHDMCVVMNDQLSLRQHTRLIIGCTAVGKKSHVFK